MSTEPRTRQTHATTVKSVWRTRTGPWGVVGRDVVMKFISFSLEKADGWEQSRSVLRIAYCISAEQCHLSHFGVGIFRLCWRKLCPRPGTPFYWTFLSPTESTDGPQVIGLSGLPPRYRWGLPPGGLDGARVTRVKHGRRRAPVQCVRGSRSGSRKHQIATSAAHETLSAGRHGGCYASPLQNPAVRQPIRCGSCHWSQIHACQRYDRRS